MTYDYDYDYDEAGSPSDVIVISHCHRRLGSYGYHP